MDKILIIFLILITCANLIAVLIDIAKIGKYIQEIESEIVFVENKIDKRGK